jgi:hypothetical protein
MAVTSSQQSIRRRGRVTSNNGGAHPDWRDEHALAVTARQAPNVGGCSWESAPPTMDTLVEPARSAAERAGRLADEGARIAEDAGLAATPARMGP